MSQEPHENAETHRNRVATKRNLKRSKRSDDSTEQTILEILSEKNDSDKNFLMTLLPALKRLSQRKNTEARIKLQQVLYDTEFADSEPRSCSNCSHLSTHSTSAPASVSSLSHDQES
jgi:hypothetical protein